MVFVKKSTFVFYVFFCAKKARKKHFLIFWVEKNAFWIAKVKFSNSRKKIDIFHGFCQKFDLFIIFFLNKKSQKETFFDILDRK